MDSSRSGYVSGWSSAIGCFNKISSYSFKTFSSFKDLTVIGIAKDGHVIYGSYLSSGRQVISGFDICNRMFYDSIGLIMRILLQVYIRTSLVVWGQEIIQHSGLVARQMDRKIIRNLSMH
jgi:hypothetical protein